MPNGYTGKILFVDLTTGKTKTDTPPDSLYRDYIGGYGLGARVLYSKMKKGVDPLGPSNMLGFVTGPLTGTPASQGSRFVVVGKSPLTGGWGDANAGGMFGPALKFAGYDAVFFTGISPKPVYLLVDYGKVEIRDAGDIWGKDIYDTEDILKQRHGSGTRVACIGPGGEKLSLIACIENEKGAAAGRSGLGAVMGSKKLKAVVARGNMRVSVADRDRIRTVREAHEKMLKEPVMGGLSPWEGLHKYGTSETTAQIALNGDTPIKNFGGIGVVDYPDPGTVSGDGAIKNLDKRIGCWGCPIQCEALLKESTGPYKYEAGNRRAEYETLAAFGGYLLNNDVEVVNKCNDICNRMGIDTISAGATIGFAIECFENGIINLEDTDGIELRWGYGPSIVAMMEKIANRDGFGDILADGSKIAAERIGRGSEKFAVHIGGQELGMHDPKFQPEMGAAQGARFVVDATPGRHTQAFGKGGFLWHLANVTGVCLFTYAADSQKGYLVDFMSAVTGWERTWDDLTTDIERIMAIRQAFNSREGINNRRDWFIHPRIMAIAHEAGPLKGVKIDIDEQIAYHFQELGWDVASCKPTKAKLQQLGLPDVAKDLWP